jgi:protein-tyrosine phosphatase
MRPPGDSYWVEQGRFLAGPYPGNPDPVRERETLSGFLDFGVRRFVDLTESGEHPPYAPTLERIASQRALDVDHVRLAIPDKSVPTRGQMRAILDLIDADLDEGESVYLHCRGGAGRTGTVVGCFLIECGLEPSDALAQIATDRSGIGSRRGRWSSPETAEQRDFVLDWRPGEG